MDGWEIPNFIYIYPFVLGENSCRGGSGGLLSGIPHAPPEPVKRVDRMAACLLFAQVEICAVHSCLGEAGWQQNLECTGGPDVCVCDRKSCALQGARAWP